MLRSRGNHDLEKENATRQLSGRVARASRQVFSFSFCEPPAAAKPYLNMANSSHYIRLLAPACWHLVEVSMEGCPLKREEGPPTLASCQSLG